MIKALKKYVDDMNSWGKIFGRPAIHLEYMTRGAKQALLEQLESDLSPESLTCDGELPAKAVAKRRTFLLNVQSELNALIAV